MKPLALTLLLTAWSILPGCASRSAVGQLPPLEGPPAQPDLTLVWVGFGACERLEEGVWVRRPAFDYEFTVHQRRYPDHWESVKHMIRRHPDYDGSAGPREQTLYFHLAMGLAAGDEVPITLRSTIGSGEGESDREFRSTTLVFHPEISSYAPFDTYRIEQTYLYETGALVETVHLEKGPQPWVRNHEEASLFAARTFEGPPTRR
jgi:hypothetical protein